MFGSPRAASCSCPSTKNRATTVFFVARKVWEAWLAVSALLRFARVGRFVHWLPGVSRIPGEVHAFRVDRRIARRFSLQILHLLGFRRRSEEEDVLTVERRQHDLN